MVNTENPSKPASNTIDAWLLIYVSYGLYAVFSLGFQKISILGAAAAGQLLCLLLPAILYAKRKTGSATGGLRLRRVGSGILWRVALLALTFIGFGELLQLATRPLIEHYFSDATSILDNLTKILKPASASGLLGNLVVVALIAPLCEEAVFRGAFRARSKGAAPCGRSWRLPSCLPWSTLIRFTSCRFFPSASRWDT